MNKIKGIISILFGLLLFSTCNNLTSDISRSIEIQGNAQELLEEDLQFDDEGYLWLTIFNEDGSMETIRIPIVEENNEVKYNEPLREPDAFMRIIDRGVWDVDNGIQNPNSGMRNSTNNLGNTGIDVLILGCGFTVAQQGQFVAEARRVAEHLIQTYPFNLYSELINVNKLSSQQLDL
jgi:hypothetical protein